MADLHWHMKDVQWYMKDVQWYRDLHHTRLNRIMDWLTSLESDIAEAIKKQDQTIKQQAEKLEKLENHIKNQDKTIKQLEKQINQLDRLAGTTRQLEKQIKNQEFLHQIQMQTIQMQQDLRFQRLEQHIDIKDDDGLTIKIQQLNQLLHPGVISSTGSSC